ncbi:MAG: sulfotransferase family protein [Hyphomonas sp. 34-62-18]|nr:MAG: sulfotransferase family protein [Hyphomonas sp. 32-62-5]OZB15405.1 MAG: sulfotransferase family protein [Hyphomonas sp. 34-62-18]
MRIAMWSGPRNLSTTMMRSFGARSDTAVIDEPFYAAYLKLTGLRHPMTDEILARHEADPGKVIDRLTGPAPDGKPVFYQKHMTHHMVSAIPMDWLGRIEQHVMLIRHPARVVASYARKMETLSAEVMGFPQQERLWGQITEAKGAVPAVVDADNILADPEGVLRRLCAAIGLAWDPAMLSWSAGPRPEDGAWAPHWYDAVWRSTGFGDPPGPLPELSGEAAAIAQDALAGYQRLLAAHV